MDQITRQITDNIIDLLPEDQQYYRPDELRNWGVPWFIVQRIQVELERNLAESMQPPKTDWANMQSDAVQRIWQQFIGAIRAEAWLPASYAQTVMETAVADVLDMLVQPRKNLPEVIFGADRELSLPQLRQRVKALVVYRHFATLLPRYMEKKGLKTLTRERAEKIIEKADEKLTSRYSPLNWAQMLEPLFSLLDDQIDTNLLRLFFEDKKKPHIARKFDLMNTAVSRAQLIEALSSPDSLNMEGFEEEQSDLFEISPSGQKEKREEENTPSGGQQPDLSEQKAEVETESPEDDRQPDERESAEEKEEHKDEEQVSEEDPITTSFHKARESHNIANKEKHWQEDAPLNAGFSDPSEDNIEAEDEEDTDLEEQEKEAGFSLNDVFQEEEPQTEHSGPEEEEQESDGEENEFSVEISEEGIETVVEVQEDQQEETPMWQRFMSPEELEEHLAEEQRQQDTEDDDLEEPVFDVTGNSVSDDETISRIRNLLEDDREFFTKEIFRGSERAYEEALEELADKQDWQHASKYIEKEVFKRNLVDMYSEAAVDFTDRLQTYFLEKSKS